MIGLLFAIVLFLLGVPIFLLCYLSYFIIVGFDAGIKNRSLKIGLAAIIATFIQFSGYGYGFLKSIWKLRFLKMEPEAAFPKLFFNNARQKKTK
jgi:hypothetical protein